jgi:hypothetical protein
MSGVIHYPQPGEAAIVLATARSLMDLTAKDDQRAAANLLGNGFLRRRQGLLLPGATGIGKSSLTMQAAILWSLARDFFGIKPQGELRSLIVQAENDDIDLVEMRDGICNGLELNPEERTAVGKNVSVLTTSDRGAKLFERLETELARQPIDLLILDPLLAYIEGAVKDQEDVSFFLRVLMQPFLVKHDCGAIVAHHTNKPASGKEKTGWQHGDHAYAGSGSIEFANWARAVVFLRSIGLPDVFELMLPKRGKRAGICDAGGSPVNSIHVRHSRKPGAIFWELADANDSKPVAPNRDTADLFRAFFGSVKDSQGSVAVAVLAKKLSVSEKTVRRRFPKPLCRLAHEGETLELGGGKVSQIEGES